MISRILLHRLSVVQQELCTFGGYSYSLISTSQHIFDVALSPFPQIGSTAVLYASFSGHKDLVQELCETFGADFLHREKVRTMQTVSDSEWLSELCMCGFNVGCDLCPFTSCSTTLAGSHFIVAVCISYPSVHCTCCSVYMSCSTACCPLVHYTC